MISRVRLAWFWTLVIFVLCWIPRAYVPGQERLPKPLLVINFDKLVHSGIFLVFAYLWMAAKPTKFRPLWVLGWGIAIAAITELGQDNRFVNRDANLPDGLADSVGVVLGIVIWWLVPSRQARPKILDDSVKSIENEV